MQYNIHELDGGLLDAAVALAEGRKFAIRRYKGNKAKGWEPEIRCHKIENVYDEEIGGATYAPSSHWAHGGPIIDRERIALVGYGTKWDAAVDGFVDTEGGISSRTGEAENAPTALVAAMRAFVLARLGAEVDL